MTFYARYPGTCTRCGSPFSAGDPILKTGQRKGSYGHVTCPTPEGQTTLADAPAPDAEPVTPVTADFYEHMTYDEFLGWVDAHPQPGPMFRAQALEEGSTCPPDSRSDYVTYDQALKMAREGWPEGLEKLVELEIEDAPRTGLKKPRCEYTPAGVRPSVPHFLAGEPAHMMNFAPRPSSRRPVLNILNCGGMSGTIGADTYERRGAALASLIDTLENMGISVALTNNYTNRSNDNHTVITLEIEVKAAGQPLDRDRLLVATSHAAFYRRLKWRWTEQDKFYNHFTGSYGGYRGIIDPPTTADTLVIPRQRANDDRPVSEIAADFLKLYEAHINQE